MKTVLGTGVEITYNKKGNIKTLYSPYYAKKRDNAVRGSLLQRAKHLLKKII